MKVIVFGCQQIAVDFIEYLSELKDVEIPFVVTYELALDRTYGYKSVMDVAKDRHLEVITEQDSSLIGRVRDVNPDIIFSVYYRKLFPKELLAVPRLGCVNIHPSSLPYYRGPVPTAWMIKNGEKKCGITIHYMDTGMDTGDILVQKEYYINDAETGFELYTRVMGLGAGLLQDSFYDIVNDKIKAMPQKGIGSYYGKLCSKRIIDWQQKAEDITNIIRVYAKPYNSAETTLFNKYVLINKATPIFDEKYIMQGTGRIVDILEGDKLVVSCADGCIVLEDYEIVPRILKEERDIYFKIGNRLGR
ncbi:MAG: methionyl-tRNA formyltransferase [Candidatus Omnitrophota bacterium]